MYECYKSSILLFFLLVYIHVLFMGIQTSVIFLRHHVDVFSIWMGETALRLLIKLLGKVCLFGTDIQKK